MPLFVEELTKSILESAEVESDRTAVPEHRGDRAELLAHHYTNAKQPLKAIPLGQKAGGMALTRMALTEAIAHLNKGLDLVAALPSSAERDGKELDMHIFLGTAWIALNFAAVQEVWDSLHPALGLAKSLRRNDALMPILWGLHAHVVTTGRVAESLGWVAQTLDAAEMYHDGDLLTVGHTNAVVSYFYLGELMTTREHAGKVLALYTEERHGPMVGLLNQDLKTFTLTWMALSTWMHGYPEQAVKISDAALAHARRLGHPFNLSWCLTYGALLFEHVGEYEEQGERVGRENSLSFVTEGLARTQFGVALIRKGEFTAGVASLKAGLVIWENGGGRLGRHLKSALAEGMAQLGDLDGALDLIGEIIACRRARLFHSLRRPAAAKRQGTKSRREIAQWRCRRDLVAV